MTTEQARRARKKAYAIISARKALTVALTAEDGEDISVVTPHVVEGLSLDQFEKRVIQHVIDRL